MKKQSILFLAGAMLALASCGGNGEENAAAQKAREDSIANAAATAATAAAQAKNDSTINAVAKFRADSAMTIKNAMDSVAAATMAKQSTTTHTVTHTATHTKAAPKQETVGNGKPKMGDAHTNSTPQSNSNTVGNGKPKMGDK